MAASEVSFGIGFDVERLRILFGQLERKGKNLAPYMGIIADDLVEAVENEYATEGRGRWEPFSPNTRRAQLDPAAKLLQDTGVMAASTQPAHGSQGGAYFAEAFSNDPKLRFHASSEPREKIPLRDPFDIDLQAVQESAIDMLLEEIVG